MLRERARWLIGRFGVGSRRACRAICLQRSTYTYKLRKSDQAPLRMRLRELAKVRRRYGYRRLTVLLQHEGWAVNHKRVYALYRQEDLGSQDNEAKEAPATCGWCRRHRPEPTNAGAWTSCRTGWRTGTTSGC